MAIIDPVRLLQANPAENLSNLNPADQAEGLTDQSLMSFPDELSAAKQQQRDDSSGYDQRGQDSPESPFNLQILPVNPTAGGAQPANIADALAASVDSGLLGIAPGSPSLTQLEVAQSIVADLPASLLADNAALSTSPVSETTDLPLDGAVAIAAPSVSVGIAQIPGAVNGEAVSKVGADALSPAIDGMLATSVAQPLNTPVTDRAPVAQISESPVPVLATPTNEASQAPLNAELSINPNTNAVFADAALTPAQDSSVAAELMPTSAESSKSAIRIDPSLTTADLSGTQSTQPFAAELIGDRLIDPLNLPASPAAQLNVGPAKVSDPDSGVQRTAAASETPVLGSLNTATPDMEGAGVLLAQSATATSNEASTAAVELPVVTVSGPASSTEDALIPAATLNARELKVSAAEPAMVEGESYAGVVSTTLAVDASDADQSALSSPGLASSMRADSIETADAKIQELRLDKVKSGAMDAQEMAVIDGSPLKEVTLPDAVESVSVTSSSNPANSLVDPSYRSAISPFTSEPRWTQSAQPVRLEPQQASLVSGPLHVEVMRVLREGGGRVILEVTPPDQGAIQLDLRLDGSGRAYLIVEGASDSTKARLEQGGAQLKEQLAELGLSLNLDMRDRSNQSDHIPFGFNPNFAQNGGGAGVDLESQLSDMPALRSGITPDGRVSIYA